MRDNEINQFLNKLEKSSTDDFEQVAEIGCRYFSTHDLLILKGKWEERLQTFKRLHKLLVNIGMSSPLLLLLALASGFLNLPVLATSLLILSPVAFLSFVAGSFYLKNTYNSKGSLEYIGLIIDEELKRRGTVNGERGTGNGERGTGNGER